jgi:hypothetical protein
MNLGGNNTMEFLEAAIFMDFSFFCGFFSGTVIYFLYYFINLVIYKNTKD